jgi:hypothetical protein
MTVLPQTRGQTIALELHGSLSAEDIEALGQLFARRTWNDRKVDLFVELGEDAGYADAAAFWTDLGLALRHRNAFRRIAVVGTSRWHALLVQLDRPFAKMFGADERYFEDTDRDAALAFVEGS